MITDSKVLIYPALWGLAKAVAPSAELIENVLMATLARYIVNYAFTSLAHIDSVSASRRILHKNPPRKQLAREFDWDNPLVGSAAAFLLVQLCTPWLNKVEELSTTSLALCFLGHYLIVEPIYYFYHLVLHWPQVYKHSHSHHHSSVITESVSGTSHPWHETLGYLAVFAFPILLPAWCGHFSYGIIYAYFIFFDIMNCIGHCNFEVVPLWLQFGPLKYLIYNTCYHSQHHTLFRKNYCLFCPLWDYLGHTVSKESYNMQRRARMSQPQKVSVVFLGHGLGWSSVLHLPMISPYLATQRHVTKVWMYPLMPLCMLFAALCRCFQRAAIVLQRYTYRNMNCATWSIPVLGYSYMSKREHPYINRLLLQAIRDAEAQGATHVGLGALNKAQGLNNGGLDLVPYLPQGCQTKLVHGNTLTAAVVYSRVRQHVEPQEEIVFTGATSTVGKAVVLRLLHDGYRIRVLTRSVERFTTLKLAAGSSGQGLSRIERFEDGADCQYWVLGAAVDRPLAKVATKNTTFLEFAVPCTADGFLQPGRVIAAASIPVNSSYCDVTLSHSHDRSTEESPVTIPACLAATIIHGLEGFQKHEVGDVDANTLDEWLALARKHGFDIGEDNCSKISEQHRKQNKQPWSESEPEGEPSLDNQPAKKRRMNSAPTDAPWIGA
jgi:sterol desaturase/sphingolipid hydroxylase (fatty acid hydroxylase superfamily)